MIRTAFAWVLSLILSAAPALAENALERQQSQLKLLRSQWQQQTPPSLAHRALRPASERDSGQDGVGLLLNDVDMLFSGQVGFHSPHLKGWLVPLQAGEPVDFDRPEALRIEVSEGEVVLSPKQLASLFNEHILAYPETQLRDFAMHIEQGRLSVTGQVQPLGVGPWLPLKLSGRLTLNRAAGRLEYAPDHLKVLGVPAYGLMSLLGLPLSALVDLQRPGAVLAGNQMQLDYHSVFPLAQISGEVVDSRLDEAGLHLRFAPAKGAAPLRFTPPNGVSGSYIWLQSGDLKIFEVLISYAQVLLKSDSPKPLQFSLRDYRKVLASGVAQVREDGSLVMQVPRYQPAAEPR